MPTKPKRTKKSSPDAKTAPKPRPEILEHSQITETAREVIRILGLQEPRAPSTAWRAKEFPEDMGSVSPEELSEQLTVWTGMLSYANYQRALIASDRDQFDRIVKRKVEDYLELEKNRSTTVTEKKAAGMKLAREIQDKLDMANSVLGLLDTLCDEFTRNYNAISREISRRGAQPLD